MRLAYPVGSFEMTHSLALIRSALAAIPDPELGALLDATGHPQSIAPGLIAYLEHACDWEQSRRRGWNFALSGPLDAVDDDEIGASFIALAIIAAATDGHPHVGALLDAVGVALHGESATVH